MNVQILNENLKRFLIKYKKKKVFLSTCIVLDPDISLKEMDQKFSFGGLIGYRNFCIYYFFAKSKSFRLHAIPST